MSKPGYTHISLVVDRSGSMSAVRDDAEGAVNQFITDQKTVPGEATLTLVEFDADHGMPSEWLHTVHDGNLVDAPVYHLAPRGSTALLDAVGATITATGEKLAALDEDARPEHVVFVVQTDGQENSSREWTVDKIRAFIRLQTDTYNWQFVFLGMGPDTFAQGHNLGFANVTKSAQAGDSYVTSYAVASNAVGNLRTNRARDLSATNVDVDKDGNVTPASG